MPRATFLVFVSLALLSMPLVARAQDATPETADPALAGLGYPELLIRVIDDAYEMPETTVPAGRTLIRLENAGAESWHGFLMRVPEEVTDEQVATDLSPEAEAPPAWLFDAAFPGFPGETLPGQTNFAVVDLTPGRYLVLGDVPQPFEVAGEVATPAPAATDLTPTAEDAHLFDFNFEFPATLAPGPQTWAVTNTGEQPHELLLASVPDGTTVEQIVSLLSLESEDATPPGGGPSWADIAPVGGMGWLSPGATAWTAVDLAPGTYVALCFVPDPETFMPHAMMGMVAVFTVDAGAGTPAP